MSKDPVAGDVVRAWVNEELPRHSAAANRASAIAVLAHEEGVSVGEACRRARAIVGSWAPPAYVRACCHVVQ